MHAHAQFSSLSLQAPEFNRAGVPGKGEGTVGGVRGSSKERGSSFTESYTHESGEAG